MPLYEYRCSCCHEVSEISKKMNDQEPKECPLCHKDGLERIYSSVGVHFQGSGFYCTDYKDKKESCPCSGECSCH